METHCLVSITAMLQVACVLDRSLKVSTPHSRNFLNVPTTFELLFYCLNNNFQTKKIGVLRRSFDRKLISPNVSRDVQKSLFDLCIMSQIDTVLAGGIWISFSSQKTSLCVQSRPILMQDEATLNNFVCVYLTEMHAQWSSRFRIWKREAV